MRKSGFYIPIYVGLPGNERKIREVGLRLDGLLDTGAELSVIPESLLSSINNQEPLHYRIVSVRETTGSTSQVKVVSLSIGIEFKGDFVVLEDIEFLVFPNAKDLLIGLNIISRLASPTAVESVNIQLISSNILRVSISLPNLISVEEYLNSFVNLLTSLSLLYKIFGLLYSQDSAAISQFANKILLQQGLPVSAVPQIKLEDLSIEPLRVISARYGSDASFDLLGFGKILEQLRETVKDIVWRGAYEKELSEANLRRVEIETEKETVEIEVKRAQIDREKIESQRVLLEIAKQRLELVEKAANMVLPDKERQLIISSLVPQLQIISESTNNLLSGGEEFPLLTESETKSNSDTEETQ